MKKLVLVCTVVLTLVACKKNESNEITSKASTSDSILPNVDASASIMDSIPKIKKDSSQVAITELKEKEKVLTEKKAKEIDSASKEVIVSEIKTTQKKIDSVKDKVASAIEKVEKVKPVAPKIIKETKVIYTAPPTPKEQIAKITKTGEVQIKVDDISTANQNTKEQVEKYNGTIKSEQIASNNDRDVTYLKVNVPADKAEFLISDLNNYVGKVEYKNVVTTGEEYTKNSNCSMEITLFTKSDATIATVPITFGGRMTDAIGSGWNVIQEIFLFLVPFWPVFLIGGGIFYYVKKKNKQQETEQNNA